MKTFAVLSLAALMGVGSLDTSPAQARGGGGALAAGIIGGLAAGALLGAAVSDSHVGPAYGYAPPPPRLVPPAYGYEPAPARFDRPAPVVRGYLYESPAYETRRVVSYERGPVDDGYRPLGRRWHGDWDHPYGFRGW